MTVPQQKLREIVFQLLFSFDLANPRDEDMEALIAKEFSVSKSTVRLAIDKMHKILAVCDEIDQLIESVLKDYALSRIQKVEKNILRLGVYELYYDDTIPPKVSIAEAMRLTKKFSTAEAASFVNAVLDALYKSKVGAEVSDTAVLKTLGSLFAVEDGLLNMISKDAQVAEVGGDFEVSGDHGIDISNGHNLDTPGSSGFDSLGGHGFDIPGE